MAYPGATLPSSFYYIDDSTEATAPTSKKFVAFTCTEAGTMTFKSTNNSARIFDVNGTSVGSSGVDIPLEVGMTIYGTFSSVTSDGTAKGVAYVG
jgi:hypothetical protein